MALVVVNRHWMALSQHSLSLDGALATKRATWRQPTPTRVKKRQRATNNAKQRHLAPSSRCPGAPRLAGKKTSQAAQLFRGQNR